MTTKRSKYQLTPIEDLFIPQDWFTTSKHNCGDISVDFFKEKDRDVAIQYEYYVRCIKNRAKAYLKRWVNQGYPLLDLIFSGIFDEHACRNKESMQQLRYECLLGKHYL